MDLHREIVCWDEHQRADSLALAAPFRVEPARGLAQSDKRGEEVGERLARSRRGNAHRVVASEQSAADGALHTPHRVDVARSESAEEGLAQRRVGVRWVGEEGGELGRQGGGEGVGAGQGDLLLGRLGDGGGRLGVRVGVGLIVGVGLGLGCLGGGGGAVAEEVEGRGERARCLLRLALALALLLLLLLVSDALNGGWSCEERLTSKSSMSFWKRDLLNRAPAVRRLNVDAMMPQVSAMRS